MGFMKLMSRIYDLPNAFRVLDVMDEAGCDIEQEFDDKWIIKPKWHVSEQGARDLRKIVLYKEQYKARSPIWKRLIFRRFRSGCRPLHFWFE